MSARWSTRRAVSRCDSSVPRRTRILEGDIYARNRLHRGKTGGGTRYAPGMFVARRRPGGRASDESGDRVSAAAADAGRRRSLARQTPGTCWQSVRCGARLAGSILSAPSPRTGESRPSPAGSTLWCADQRNPSQPGPGGAHGSDPPGEKISQVHGRMGPAVSCCWP